MICNSLLSGQQEANKGHKIEVTENKICEKYQVFRNSLSWKDFGHSSAKQYNIYKHKKQIHKIK